MSTFKNESYGSSGFIILRLQIALTRPFEAHVCFPSVRMESIMARQRLYGR